MLDVELKFLALHGKDLYSCDLSQFWITVAEVCFFPWQDHISSSLICLNAVLLPFVVGLCSSSFQVPFQGNYSIFVNLLCPLEEVSSEFRVFLYHHLEPSTCMLYFYLSFYHMVSSYNTEESNSL